MASHLWLFFLPVILAGRAPGVAFWIGALYVTMPLGMLIYGWNDYFDADVDAISRRKKETRVASFFGYRLTRDQRKLLPAYIVAFHVPFVMLAVIVGEFWVLGWLAVMVIANGLYNGPGLRLSRVPVLAEATATWIYLNILWLSVEITGHRQTWAVWVIAAAAVLTFQIGGAIVDIKSDREVNKVTFAVAVGENWSSRALSAVVAVKAIVLVTVLAAPIAGLLNLVAIPACLAKPDLGKYHWAGTAYLYFLIVDWVTLGLLAG
jgi:4-hydroxybenzoate polyprenyltransferase